MHATCTLCGSIQTHVRDSDGNHFCSTDCRNAWHEFEDEGVCPVCRTADVVPGRRTCAAVNCRATVEGGPHPLALLLLAQAYVKENGYTATANVLMRAGGMDPRWTADQIDR